MDAISQSPFSIAFSWMNIFEFWLTFDWLKFVPNGSINNIPATVQIMAWRRPGDKTLSEPMVVSLPTPICVIWPQWVNWLRVFAYTGELSGKPRFQCHHCKKFFVQKSSCTRHIKFQHERKSEACNACNASFFATHPRWNPISAPCTETKVFPARFVQTFIKQSMVWQHM